MKILPMIGFMFLCVCFGCITTNIPCDEEIKKNKDLVQQVNTLQDVVNAYQDSCKGNLEYVDSTQHHIFHPAR